MIAAEEAVQRPLDAKLLVVNSKRNLIHVPRSAFVDFLHPNDVVIANDAATLPASLTGFHQRAGKSIEVRLAGRPSLNPMDVKRFSSVVFGEGDFHSRTEDGPLPPALKIGDVLLLGPLRATVEELMGHPRLVSLLFSGSPDEVWAGLAHHGRPIQYSHMQTSLELWDVTRERGGRVIAVGTTVVRALEDAATEVGQLRAGEGIATGRIGPTTRLRVVDAILSGTHERGTSHYKLLRAFLEDSTLEQDTRVRRFSLNPVNPVNRI
jgi:S-adenosylmethionine:tRNA ribosyltransferase-isomerase